MDSVLQAGIVSAPLQVIIDRLATLTVNEISHIVGVDEQLRKLRRILERIRAMVGHVEENHSFLSNNISSDAWKVWLEDVEKLSYSADDLLDGISLDLSKYRSNLSTDANGDNQVRSLLLSSFELTVPRQISKISQELEDIAKEMDALFMVELTKMGSNNKIFKSKYAYSSYSCARGSLVNEELVIGRERQRDEIIELLLDEDMRGNIVSVIPIVGMGGIGKTTLTQIVYKDDRVVEKFDLRIWVSVLMNFDSIRITKSIVESVTGKRCKLCELDLVQVKLQALLEGKRFLLVLDDYWSEEYGDWDVLSSPFKFGLEGSKILVTTRSKIVSRILGSVPSYDLEILTDENCWELMKQRAFSNKTTEEKLHLEEIGRIIARKCKGLPLAAKTLGSMLHFKCDVEEWNFVLISEIWSFQINNNDTLPALALSYHHLPSHLKKCFAYCSIFPKNYDFQVDELVLLWMAEGFIRPVGKRRLEDIGMDYFKDLLWRSFFQAYGEKNYKMHDLIHSMAQMVSAYKCFHLEYNITNEDYTLCSTARHFSLNFEGMQPTMLKCFPWYKNLRTFRVMCGSTGNLQVSYDLFLKLKSLRVLDLRRMGLDEVHDSIDHLKHLRYLNLSENPLRKLPESITNLFGIETLKLEQCSKLLELPRTMKKMISLRHLHLNVKQLNYMPSEFGMLVNLQSLNTFIVGITEGCGIGELKNMRLLRGSICIKNLENVSNLNEAKEAMLSMKPYLDKLELQWDYPRSGNNEEEILAGLCPHENLKELVLTNYKGFLLPSWLSSPLCKLSSIRIQSCQHYTILTALGILPHLKHLHIEDMSDCLHIKEEFSGFQSLESLTIIDMPNLIHWEGISGGSFPCLSALSIISCPLLTKLPSLVNLQLLLSLNIHRCPQLMSLPDLPVSHQVLVISESDIIKDRCRSEEGEDWHKIRVIPKIEIDYVAIHG